MAEKTYTIKCHNRRPKGGSSYERCNRVIGQLKGLPDIAVTLYCPACKAFMVLEVVNKSPKLTPVDKLNMDFSNTLACEIGGYQTRGL